MQRKWACCASRDWSPWRPRHAAQAQYAAPPPDPGFHYIFDGTATGSDASFDKWKFAAGTHAQSAPAAQGGQGQATLDPAEGVVHRRRLAVRRLLVPGQAVRRRGVPHPVHGRRTRRPSTPQRRHHDPHARGRATRRRERRAAVLGRRSRRGFNYDALPRARLRGLPAASRPAAVDRPTTGPARRGPFPPASNASDPAVRVLPAATARARPPRASTTSTASTASPLTVNGNADNHQHWTQVYCGHEIQINESLTGTGPLGGSDPIKTGSIYGFRNLNAQQSGTYKRLDKGVWHQYEIRTIGQQYTILIDGEMINQFDNSIPKIASRAGDPPTMARQFTRGYLGLQTHGGNDRISYREIQVKEFAPADIPVNTVAPSVTRHRLPGQAADLQPRHLERRRGHRRTSSSWYRVEQDPGDQPALPRPEPARLRQLHARRPTAEYGNQALTWLDSQIVGDGRHLHADRRRRRQGHPLRGQRRQRRRDGVEDRGRPGDPRRDHADGAAGGTVPATLSPHARHARRVRRRSPRAWRRTTTRPPRPTSSPPPATRRCRCPSPGT